VTGGAAAEPIPPTGTIHTIDLPGGVEGIRRAVGDRRTTPPAMIGIDVARRFHNATALASREDPALARLLTWLHVCARHVGCGARDLTPDRVPLPGDPDFWRKAAFDATVPDARLMAAILERRDTAFLYAALLSMREDARAWLIARPAVARALAADVSALVIAAPYLRLEEGRWQLPGGADAMPIWAALAGAPADRAEAFLPALLRAHGGLVAYLIEVVATLSPAQQRAVLALSADEPRRIAAGFELLAGVRAASRIWPLRERPYSRPAHDPAFLLAQVPVAGDGTLAVPGSRAFWTLVFGAGPLEPRDEDVRALSRDPVPASAGWLVERVWLAPPPEQATRYEQVLFAVRHLAAANADGSQAATAATVLRGYARFPQLLRVLDRLGAGDPARLAALVRRADALTQAGDWRRRAALVRWQAVLAMLDHMTRIGSLDAAERDRALDVLADAAAEPGASRGARLRALAAAVGPAPAAGDVRTRPIEQALIARITRSRIDAGRRVTWEGQPYVIDVGAAERDRVAKVRGRDALPRLDAAWMAFALADDAAPGPGAAAGVSDITGTLATLAAATRLDRPAASDDALDREARTALTTARRALEGAPSGRVSAEARAALDDLGEALATTGLAEISYALAMGWAEDLPLTALAAFRRHVFSEPAAGTLEAFWQAPVVVTGRGDPWHVAGSLLGLDDALGPVALRRPSLRPLGAAPALNTGDRRWLVSTVAGIDRRSFTDGAQRRLVDLLARGRAAIASAHGSDAVRDTAERAGTSPLRQTLAGWLATIEPNGVAGVFSMTDVLRLGASGDGPADGFDGWAPVQVPLTGRLAPGPLPAWPWERYTGRSTRLVSCALPDLTITLAERLAELELPASLIPDLLPPATFELVNTAMPRHADDFDALAERVRLVDRRAVERYLGMLTVGGPLRPAAAPHTP
jgi:hypothetical protein